MSLAVFASYLKETVYLTFKFHWASYILLTTDRETATMDLPPAPFLPHPLYQAWDGTCCCHNQPSRRAISIYIKMPNLDGCRTNLRFLQGECNSLDWNAR